MERPAKRLRNGFQLRKRKGDSVLIATCEVWTNPLGWELRLMTEGKRLEIASIVRSRLEKWKAAMLEKGWG